MKRTSPQLLTILVLLPGIVLRAATPAGYMPAAAGSGLLFELCPDQLPAGVTLATSQAHKHHQHEGGEAAVDLCQLGHLFIATAAGDTAADVDLAPPPASANPGPRTSRLVGRAVTLTRSRGPPA